VSNLYSSLPPMFRPQKGRDVPQPDTSSKVPDAVRVASFRSQLEAWLRSGGVAVPLLVLPDAPPPAEGQCISCGVALDPGQTWRCATCLEAVNVALAEERR